jgi:hypothetical protein
MLLNANRNDKINPVAEYHKIRNTLNILDDSPLWFKNDLHFFIENEIKVRDSYKAKLNPWDSDDPDTDRQRGRGR